MTIISQLKSFVQKGRVFSFLEYIVNITFYLLSLIFGKKIANELYDRIFPPEPEMTQVFNTIVNQEVVIDLGAYLGHYSRLAALKSKLVIAVEPHPQRIERLRKECDTYTNIIPVQSFISDQNGTADIFEESYERKWLPFKPSRGDINNTYTRFHIHDKLANPITIQTMTLDTLTQEHGIKKVGVIKIDVEGSELNVLRGGKKTLENTNHVLIEYHYSENDPRYIQCQRILSELGFQFIKLWPDGQYVHYYKYLESGS